jgi:Ca2+:H+ antiporter
LGTLVLALSVTVIEVALILNMMKTHPETAGTIARDTVFATVMIVTNGIVGVSILLGGLRHKELSFQTVGTSALMSVLATLSAITMILPNYTTSSSGPTYTLYQLIFISVAALIIYISLIWAQTKSHKNYFETMTEIQFAKLEQDDYVPKKTKTVISFIGLIVSLIVVVGLSKVLSPTIGLVVNYVGAPASAIGVIVALLVLAPETFAALSSAKANRLQTSLNFALGSGAASVALTIPVVAIYSILHDQRLILGIDAKSTALLILTFLAAGFTFGSGRTTALHGIVHLVILFSYIVITFIP